MDLPNQGGANWLWSRWVLWMLMGLAAIYAIVEHRQHLISALPYLIFLACPLMHMFHGRGHHHPGTSSQQKGDLNDQKARTHHC